MLNRVQLIGNLGHDPETRLTKDGRTFVTFSMATNSSWKDENGSWQTQTDWHKITVFREALTASIRAALKKGDRVFIEGRLNYSTWEDSYDQKHYSSHITIFPREGIIEFIRSLNSENQEERCLEDNNLQTDAAASFLKTPKNSNNKSKGEKNENSTSNI